MFRKPHFILFVTCVFLMIFEGVSAQSTPMPSPLRLLAETKVSETINDMDWSDANQLLAVGTDDGVYIYTADLQPVTHFLAHGDAGILDLAWKPDGTQLATVGLTDLNALIWDYDPVAHQFTQAEVVPTNVTNYRGAQSVEWSPDGSQLAVMQVYTVDGSIDQYGAVEIFETQNWTIDLTLQPDRLIFPAPFLDWNPVANSIVFGDYYCSNEDCIRPQLSPTFFVSDTVTGQRLFSDDDLDGIFGARWSPDGNKLLVPASMLRIYDVSQGQLIPLSGWNPLEDIRNLLFWSSNGQRVLGMNALNKVRIYNVSPQVLLGEFDTVSSIDDVNAAYWTDQDQKLFLGTGSGNLSVWNTDFECADC